MTAGCVRRLKEERVGGPWTSVCQHHYIRNSLDSQEGGVVMSVWLGSQQRLRLSPGKLRGRRHLSIGSKRKGVQPGSQGVSEVIYKMSRDLIWGCASDTRYRAAFLGLSEWCLFPQGEKTRAWSIGLRAGFYSRTSVWVSNWESCPYHSHQQIFKIIIVINESWDIFQATFLGKQDTSNCLNNKSLKNWFVPWHWEGNCECLLNESINDGMNKWHFPVRAIESTANPKPPTEAVQLLWWGGWMNK